VLSNRPTVVQDDVTIDLPDERDQLTTRADPRFTELRHHIYAEIQRAKGFSGDSAPSSDSAPDYRLPSNLSRPSAGDAQGGAGSA